LPPELYIGADVGARKIHLVAVDRRLCVAGTALFAGDDVADAAEWSRDAALVAVDAPAELSEEPHRGEDGLSPKFRRARCAEIAPGAELGIWVPWVAPPSEPPAWMETGLAFYAELGKRGTAGRARRGRDRARRRRRRGAEDHVRPRRLGDLGARTSRRRGGGRRPQPLVSSATVSMCGVCGNMSTGRARSSRKPHSRESSLTFPASVVGLHET
jgi:hypothetical protein